MALKSKELELAAIGISFAAGCVPCTKYHIAKSIKLNALEADVTLSMCVAMDVAADSLSDLRKQFDIDVPLTKRATARKSQCRNSVLTAVGAAFANNSVKQLQASIDSARHIGIKDDEIMQIIGLSNRIQEKAASHLVQITSKLDADPRIATAAASFCT